MTLPIIWFNNSVWMGCSIFSLFSNFFVLWNHMYPLIMFLLFWVACITGIWSYITVVIGQIISLYYVYKPQVWNTSRHFITETVIASSIFFFKLPFHMKIPMHVVLKLVLLGSAPFYSTCQPPLLKNMTNPNPFAHRAIQFSFGNEEHLDFNHFPCLTWSALHNINYQKIWWTEFPKSINCLEHVLISVMSTVFLCLPVVIMPSAAEAERCICFLDFQFSRVLSIHSVFITLGYLLLCERLWWLNWTAVLNMSKDILIRFLSVPGVPISNTL